MSATRNKIIIIYKEVLAWNAFYTCTVEPISFKAFPTCAVKAAICISAVGIGAAWICLQFTLIDICNIEVHAR